MFPLKVKLTVVILGFGVIGASAWSLAKAPVRSPLPLVKPVRQAAPRRVPKRTHPETFLVIDNGTALIGPDGKEITRLDSIANAAGAMSPDGDLVAFSKADAEGKRNEVIIQSRSRPQERTSIPQFWGSGSSFLPLWSSDAKRILICEQGRNADGDLQSAHRLYDLDTKEITPLRLPDAWWPSDWSADGKRLLATPGDTLRVAWVNIDGSGAPEFITSEADVAYGARLSPDGRRILCMVGPRVEVDGPRSMRLSVIDLESKKRITVDQPGETAGYCWSVDGSKIAYTWQSPLEKPAEVPLRETLLITCDPDGHNRKTVTSRKYEIPMNSSGRDGMVIFFQVSAWR